MGLRKLVIGMMLGLGLLGLGACGGANSSEQSSGPAPTDPGSAPSGPPAASGPQPLDTTLNHTGYVYRGHTAGGTYDAPYAIAIDAQGRYILVGLSQSGGHRGYLTIWKYNPDGTQYKLFNSPIGYLTGTGTTGGSDNATAITLDSQGRLLVVGCSYGSGGAGSMGLWRYNSDGSLDSTFAGKGYLTRQGTAGGSSDSGLAVAVDAMGRVVVVGNSEDAASTLHMAVWRFNADGSPDLTFNGTGSVLRTGTAPGAASDYAQGLVLDRQGRIVVVGSSGTQSTATTPYTSYTVVWRFNANGTPDTSFNGTGYSVWGATSGRRQDGAAGIVLDGKGRLVVSGSSTYGPDLSHATVWRFNPDGTPDTSFAGTGFVNMAGAAPEMSAFAGQAQVDDDGRIVVSGSALNPVGYSDLALWRYQDNGNPDTTFNGSGALFRTNTGGGQADSGGLLVLDNLGRIVVAGTTLNPDGQTDIAIWRYLP